MDNASTPEELVDLLPKYFTLCLVSVRNSGKSVLIQEIMKDIIKRKKADIVCVMSGSAGLNDDYNFLPSNLVMPFDDAILHKIWNNQVAIVQKDKTKARHIFIVFDDCLANKEAIRNEILQKIWVQGRHIFISACILSQYPAFVLSPTIIGNSDLFLYSKLNRKALERVWSATVGISFRDFMKISESIGGVNFTFMVINNYCKSPDPFQYLSYVRAALKKVKGQGEAKGETEQ